ncbi:hypothetical protein [Polaromonas sp. DSR2-3-2]|uniref:hypothetical protein n=1 Tax=unclassified Polaromonas TaxID=2638319 RepID=UPI003CE7FE90
MLLDLAAIQECITNDEITPNDLWVATDSADDDLYQMQWDEQSICEFIKILEPQDYKKSEWAKSASNSRHACDVYVVRFDDEAWERDPNALKYYIKFSADANGALKICLISCHPSRYQN